jgi:hypothetical protein
MSTAWYDLYSAAFLKRLTPDEIEAYDEMFDREIKYMKPGEVARAVQSLASEWRTKRGEKYPPSANDIISRIIKLKYMDKLEDPRFAKTHRVLVHKFNDELGREEMHIENESPDLWQKDIRQAAGNPDRVGNVICRPLDLDECKERESFANKLGIEYKFAGVTI